MVQSVAIKSSPVGVAMLAAGVFTFAIGVAGTMFAMRSAVGTYDFHAAVFGLSPPNLAYSVECGFWSGGFGVAFLWMSFVFLQSKLHRDIAIAASLGIALSAVAAIVFFKWIFWAGTAAC